MRSQPDGGDRKRREPLAAAVARHRDAVLALCIGDNKGVKAQQRYLVLRQDLQGDLQLETVDVYFFGDYSTKESLDAAVRSWAHRLSFNLFPRKHKVFCRSRWQTFSTTISEMTLLGAVHNLLHRAIPVWLTLMGHKLGLVFFLLGFLPALLSLSLFKTSDFLD